jgi:dTDP-4-amino-4,6-dideoxygalactose transaminase
MKIPFLDLKTQYKSIKGEIDEAIQEVIDSCAFAGGKFVEQFEEAFADFCQCEHAVGVGSGTEALWLALLALEVGAGDEVITVPNTFIATAEAISFCGAKPVFIDIDERTYTMNPSLIEPAITPRTKAIIPVHIFGHMADMDPIMEIARANSVFVIEDACQAHGAEYRGKRAGSIGDAGCFSFYPGKNLGAFGEAGAVVTQNVKVADKIRILRDHGQSQKYYHEIIGWNARMDGIQGAVLKVKLKYLNFWNDARRKNAKIYDSRLTDYRDVIQPYEADYGRHVYHIYAVRFKNRDRFIAQLAKKGISCGIHYPVPVHLQNAYPPDFFTKNSFPVAERCSEEFVSLPMYPELSEEQIDHVTNIIYEFINLDHAN